MYKNTISNGVAITNGLFKHKTDNIFIQLTRYTFVGLVAFLSDYSCLYLFTEILGSYYLISAPIAFLIGLLVHYFISVKWVFSKRSLDKKWLELFIYVSFGAIGLGMNEIIIWFCTEKLHFHYMVSKLFYFIVYVINFFGRKYFLFR